MGGKKIKLMKSRRLFVIITSVLVLFGVSFYLLGEFDTNSQVDYSADVKPILNKKCISCHGGVKKNADFSLLFEDEALAPTESGHPAIIPGNSKESEFIRRITHSDPEVRMPPEGEPLSKEEVAILSAWIEQGAEFDDHWAYVKPEKVDPPENDKFFWASADGASPESWPNNEIDKFVLAKLNELDLSPSPRADRRTLIRRVSLDLIGLPPTPEETEAFVNDTSDDAYEKLVDRLLASPKFGEKWGSMWLDLARYADSKGYQKDHHRNIWKYRDWVINAFNQDMPFDQFTREQLAGDMLPNPSDDQLLATAFHRNTMENDEGGTDDEEFRVAAVLDRVNTTMEVWQGTTFACVQCHSHPYDPFRHEEYYTMYAFFNNSQDKDLANGEPMYPFYPEEDEQKMDSLIAWVEQVGEVDVKAEHSIMKRKRNALLPRLMAIDHDDEYNTDPAYRRAIVANIRDSAYLRFDRLDLSAWQEVTYTYAADHESQVEIRLDSLNGPIVSQTLLPAASDSKQKLQHTADLDEVQGMHDLFVFFYKDKGTLHLSELQFGPISAPHPQLAALRDSLLDITPIYMPIMREMPRDRARETHVFERGNWLVHGSEVRPDVPNSLNSLADFPQNRLGLAEWLVSENNPLTARVTVNRFWEQLFGFGLVRTLEDFGTQGDRPSHPQLIDWLAVEFMDEYQWRMKRLIKTIVMSATYQQSSKVSPELNELDPDNKWLARGPRHRLSAEQLRDQALAVSGLISYKMHGPSVMPYQPEGIWNTIRHVMSWKTSEGEDKYRRGLYTYWRRSSPYPSMITFDSPSRSLCVSRRIRTNTPLQALVTLNDPVYFEAAQALAGRMQQEGGDDVTAQLQKGYELALSRPMPEGKLSSLNKYYQETKAAYQEKPEEAKKVATHVPDAGPEDAALVMAANVILNLDEFITKE